MLDFQTSNHSPHHNFTVPTETLPLADMPFNNSCPLAKLPLEVLGMILSYDIGAESALNFIAAVSNNPTNPAPNRTLPHAEEALHQLERRYPLNQENEPIYRVAKLKTRLCLLGLEAVGHDRNPVASRRQRRNQVHAVACGCAGSDKRLVGSMQRDLSIGKCRTRGVGHLTRKARVSNLRMRGRQLHCKTTDQRQNASQRSFHSSPS